MICKSCGNKVVKGTDFCPICGQDLTGDKMKPCKHKSKLSNKLTLAIINLISLFLLLVVHITLVVVEGNIPTTSFSFPKFFSILVGITSIVCVLLSAILSLIFLLDTKAFNLKDEVKPKIALTNFIVILVAALLSLTLSIFRSIVGKSFNTFLLSTISFSGLFSIVILSFINNPYLCLKQKSENHTCKKPINEVETIEEIKEEEKEV